MKKYRNARVAWQSDATYLGGVIEAALPVTADVFVNGGNAVINAEINGVATRIDRLLDAEITEHKGRRAKDSGVNITGRSSLLSRMGLHPEEQKVTIEVRGAQCANC